MEMTTMIHSNVLQSVFLCHYPEFMEMGIENNKVGSMRNDAERLAMTAHEQTCGRNNRVQDLIERYLIIHTSVEFRSEIRMKNLQ